MRQNQPQIHVPKISPVNKIILIIFAVIFILNSISFKLFSIDLSMIFGLSANRFLSGHIYELFTYIFLDNSLMSVIFSSLLVWFIGSDLEVSWGMKKYLNFIFATCLGGGFLYSLFTGFILGGLSSGVPYLGLSGLCNSLIICYGILFPNRYFTFMFIFPMQAKYFCAFLVGILLYMGIFSNGGVSVVGDLFSMLSGFLYFWFFIFKSRGRGITFNKKKKRAPHLKIVKEDYDSNSKNPKYWQ